MEYLSRREMLHFLAIVLPATLMGFKGKDYFDKELVCIHIYNLDQPLPKPMLEKAKRIKNRLPGKEYFQIGMPELILCRLEMSLLDMFQYYWPVSRSEIRHLQKKIKILFKKQVIEKIDALDDFQKVLDRKINVLQHSKELLAVILTVNDYTIHACPNIVHICQSKGVNELIIFKDPSQPPYLCSYPSQQKGFKRPPPYLSNSVKAVLAANNRYFHRGFRRVNP